MLCKAQLVPQSPSKVCVECYDEADENQNTRWLPWLECARPKEHEQNERITVIVGDNHEVLEVTELPSSLSTADPSRLTLCRKVNLPGGCPDDDSCNFPHSDEELEYWKWNIVHQYLGKVTNSVPL